MSDAEKAALEHLARHKELELEYSDSAHIGIFLAGVKWAAPKWISVKERLPETGHDVLVVTNKGEQVVATWHEDQQSFCPSLTFVSGYDCGIDDIPIVANHSYEESATHWMPLPEPPKEEK